DFMSLAHWSLKNWRNLRESGKSPVRERKISSHNVTLYMKHSLLVCDLRKLLPQSKNGSCRWYRLAIRNDSREMILSRGALIGARIGRRNTGQLSTPRIKPAPLSRSS